MSALTPFLPGGFVIVILVALLVSGLVAYALRTKGDVHVLFSRGKTIFQLEAKERGSKR